MNGMIKPLLAASQVLLLAGCPAWDTSGELDDTSTLKCSSKGCLTCDKYGACYQYLCETSYQCPSGYQCNASNACMPQGTGLLGGGPTACTADSQCAPGQVCEAAACVDAAPQPTIQCAVSADCGADRICSAGKCISDPGEVPVEPPVSACKMNSDCGAGLECSQGTCTAKKFPLRPEGTCQFKQDCGTAGTCVNTKCYFPPAQGLCPPGSKDLAGLCMPNLDALGECKFSSDCGENALCKNATCITICADDTSCKKGNFCGKDSLCVLDDRPILQCLSDADCPASVRSCADGRCLADCQATTAGTGMCSLSSEQCSLGLCMPTAACFEQMDCVTSEADLDCINGQCDALLTANKGTLPADAPPADAPPTDEPPAP